MTKVEKQKLDAAAQVLRSELVKVLGPKLPGVTGFGPALDIGSDNLALRVLVNPRAERKLQRTLPNAIAGLPVRLALAGVGRLD